MNNKRKLGSDCQLMKIEKKLHKLTKKLRKLDSDKESTSGIHLPPDETESISMEPFDEDVDQSECDKVDNIQLKIEPVESGSVQSDDFDFDLDFEEILSALGTVDEIEKGPTAHEEIVNRWNPIISKGLNKDVKTELLNRHIPFQNINMTPPKLNPELTAAVSEATRKRDFIIEGRQKQVAVALAALGKALNLFIKKGNKVDIVRHVNDAAKLMCDMLYMDTKSRRSLISSAINKDMKGCLTGVADSLLFGQNLAEKIQIAKTVQESVKDLKTTESVLQATVQKHPKTSHWRGPRANARYTTGRRPNLPAVKPKSKEDKKIHPFWQNVNNYNWR